MYYGDDVVVTKNGLIIKEKALLPVGISDKSICWGVELSPHPDKIGDQFPHLVISAFPPAHWHSLFQVVIRIKNTKGSLAAAATALNGLGINILSTQCAPSGHSHATWHVIGEDLALKAQFDKALTDLFKDKTKDKKRSLYDPSISVIDADGNDEFLLRLEEEVSQEAFNRSREIEDDLFAKGKEDFLRLFCRRREDQYVVSGESAPLYGMKSLLYTDRIFYTEEMLNPLKRRTVEKIEAKKEAIRNEIEKIMGELNKNPPDSERLSRDVAKLEEEFSAFNLILEKDYDNFAEMLRREEAETVVSRWSKNLAVFRIYSQANQGRGSKVNYNDPISFTYDASNELLTPRRDTDRYKYDQLVDFFASKTELPVRAIAAFDPQERYVRFVFPNGKKKVSIKLRYFLNRLDDRPPSEKSSIGLLRDSTKRINDHGINLDYVENSIIGYSREKEEGVISFIGTFENDRADKVAKTIAAVKNDLEKLTDIGGGKARGDIYTAEVFELGSKQIFISTKFDFIINIKPAFKEKLEDLVKKSGFIPVFGDPTENPTGLTDPDLEEVISNRIRECDGFLLLIPRQLSLNPSDNTEDTEQAWLLYEFGVARGAGIPFEICVDESKREKYPVKIGSKWAKFTFDSSKDTDDILNEVKKALVSLRKRLYRKDR